MMEDNSKTLYDKNTLESMQCMGLDFMLRYPKFQEAKEIYYCSEFACFSAIINGTFSIVFTSTVMYPCDYDEEIDEKKDAFKDFMKKKNIQIKSPCNIYALGIGAIRKNATNDKEKGEFIIGEKYEIAIGYLSMFSTSLENSYGYNISDPIKLSMVSDEYYVLENIKCKDGIIIDKRRLGSYNGGNGDILDLWSIIVERDELLFEYRLYMNPYAYEKFKKFDIKVPEPFLFIK